MFLIKYPQTMLHEGFELNVKEHESFSIVFRLKLSTEAEAQHWLKSFQECLQDLPKMSA